MIYPPAIWRPSLKHGYPSGDAHLNRGAVCHSMEGSLAAAFGELDNPQRLASWHFSVAKNGAVYQHVDTDNIAWTNGSYNANKRFWGIENEGKAGEPIVGAQLDALTALLDWLLTFYELAPVRKETLFEHNEMTIYNAAPTACPSGRVPWDAIIGELTAPTPAPPQEDDMTPEESAKLNTVWQKVEEMYPVVMAPGGTLTLSAADIEKIAKRVVDLEAERLKA